MFLSDTEIRERLNIPEKRWRPAVQHFERQGFPRVDPLIGKRYWPAIETWLLQRYAGGTMPPTGTPARPCATAARPWPRRSRWRRSGVQAASLRSNVRTPVRTCQNAAIDLKRKIVKVQQKPALTQAIEIIIARSDGCSLCVPMGPQGAIARQNALPQRAGGGNG